MGVINDSIFCVGGNVLGSRYAYYKSVIVYDIPSNTWSVDSARISSRRHWMATAEYKGGLYVLGGIDSLSNAVDIVEEIVPQGTSVGVQEQNNFLPTDFIVTQNYPNPFNPSTTIQFQLPKRARVTLRILDPLGKEVETLLNEQLPAGSYEKIWQPADLPSGIYFYNLQAGEFQTVKKMILLR